MTPKMLISLSHSVFVLGAIKRPLGKLMDRDRITIIIRTVNFLQAKKMIASPLKPDNNTFFSTSFVCTLLNFKVSDGIRDVSGRSWSGWRQVGDRIFFMNYKTWKFFLRNSLKKFHGLGRQPQHFIGLIWRRKDVSLDQNQTTWG